MKRIIKTYNQSAFTLIELLVVITIIGILIALGTFAFISAQKSARDTQRKNDLRQYQIALANYASHHDGFYPETASVNASTLCTGTGVLSSYLSSCPDDSITTSHYRYQSSTKTEYTLWADLENGPYWLVSSSGTAEETVSVPGGASPTPTPTPGATSPPGATPTPTPPPTPTPTPTPTPSATPTPTPTPTPGTPAWSGCFTTSSTTCNDFCSSLIPAKTVAQCIISGNGFCICGYSDTTCSTFIGCSPNCSYSINSFASGQSAQCCCQ